MTKKILLVIFSILLLFPALVNADNYIFYYGQWCSHCAKVEKYMNDNGVEIEEKEVFSNPQNGAEFLKKMEELWVKTEDVWVPVLYIEKDNWEKLQLSWDAPIISFFEKNKDNEDLFKKTKEITSTEEKTELNFDPLKFLFILIPAALSDSINPCAFAVILILLWAVLSKFRSKRKVILTWLSFSLAIFLSYLLMWLWFYNVLWTFNSTSYFKLWVWILWVIIWLANLKDVFWYGKWFVMEVPFSWRPAMKGLIKKATSPIWGFFIWLIVSLFLLPCTSWPYITVLWYLSTENALVQSWGIAFLVLYNVIFVLPMVVITFAISLWYVWVDTLMEIKEEKNELIHLVVWILMLWLGIYVIWDSLPIY